MPTIVNAADPASKTSKIISGGTTLVKKGLGAAAGAAISGVGQLLSVGVEAAGSLLVWLFVVYELSKIFADLFSGIFLFLINFLIGVSQYNSFLGSQVVTIGWTVTRDIANMFLVVALLVIAFATILNINSYQASNLLKEFFFAAILVNFSKMICGVLIDAAQVVMMTFVSGYSETAAGNFVKLFKIDAWLQLALGVAKDQTAGTGVDTALKSAEALAAGADAINKATGNFFSGITTNIFTTIIAFIGILAVLSLDIILVVRIVTLWFLIVASPIAFVAKVLPVTKGFSSQWWHAFNKQLIAGPLVAFIVWISLASIAVSDNAFDLTSEAAQNANGQNKLFAESNAAAPAGGQLAATKISQWENLALYFIPIVIFIMGAKWAVGVAGGAAKSISGFANKKLNGYARSGLSMLKKQAVGKGQFSVLTQTKKGLSGEGGFTTAALGGIAGYGVSKVLPHKAANKVNDWGSTFMGGQAQARRRELIQGAKNIGSKAGLGDLGHKRHEIHNADAEATMYRKRAAKELEEGYAAAARFPEGSDARKKAEEAALSRANQWQKKADEAIHHAEDAQKEVFKAEGLTDDGVLLAAMKEKVEHGHVSETELAAAKKMIGESVDKKVNDEITKKRKAWAAERKDFVDAGGDPNDFRKFDETAVRGEAENEFGIKKTNPKDPANPGIEDLYKKYKAEPPLNITDNSSKTPTRVREEAAKKTAETEGGKLNAAYVTVANNYSVDMKTPGNTVPARNRLATDAGHQLSGAAVAGASDKDLKAAAQRVINMVPAPGRAVFTADLRAAAGGNPQVIAAINDIQREISTINPSSVANDIEARYNKRREEKPESSIQLNMKDVGAKTDSSGKLTLPPEAISQLEAVIKRDPKYVARLGPEVLGHPDVKRMIGHAIETQAQAIDIVMQMGDDGIDKKVAKQMARHLADAIKTANPDAGMKANADSLPGLV